jgi:hypothetical protein
MTRHRISQLVHNLQAVEVRVASVRHKKKSSLSKRATIYVLGVGQDLITLHFQVRNCSELKMLLKEVERASHERCSRALPIDALAAGDASIQAAQCERGEAENNLPANPLKARSDRAFEPVRGK